MARLGRAIRLGTQYLTTPIDQGGTEVVGNPNFRLIASGTVRVYLRITGSAVFQLNATGDVDANQKVRGSALFALNAAGVVAILGGGAASTQFSSGFSELGEALAGLALVDEFAPTHPYLQAAAAAFKKMATQGEPTTIGPIGTQNVLAKFSGPSQIGNSSISDDGTAVSITGIVDTSGVYKVAGTQVLSTRKTGYVAMTGTPNRGTSYATGTITLIQLAERVKALQDDLMSHGAIGA